MNPWFGALEFSTSANWSVPQTDDGPGLPPGHRRTSEALMRYFLRLSMKAMIFRISSCGTRSPNGCMAPLAPA